MAISVFIYIPYSQVSSGNPVNIDSDFQFTQTANPSSFKISFNVPSLSLFRVLVTYDFAWNDLALRLDIPGSEDDIYGELEYNKNEIETTQLNPGNYVLYIYEPFDTTARGFVLRDCVQFHMTVGQN